MFDGYRGLGTAALAAALLMAFGLGAYWAGLPYPQQRYQSYQDSKANEGRPLSTVPDITAPVMERTPCNEPQSEGESDLCAQWRAAKAAEKSAVWTVYGFWATLAGMALLAWQIMLTREAVKDTGDATLAMQRSNEIAEQALQINRDIGSIQTRAYLSIDRLAMLDLEDGGNIQLTIKNTGNSPALNAQIAYCVYGLGRPFRNNPDRPEIVWPQGKNPRTSIGSGSEINFSITTINTEIDFRVIKGPFNANEFAYFVWVCMEYEDVFSVAHKFAMRHVYSFDQALQGNGFLVLPDDYQED